MSILTKGSGQRLIYRPERLPAEFTPLVQSSQWLTMWMAHASVLAADEGGDGCALGADAAGY